MQLRGLKSYAALMSFALLVSACGGGGGGGPQQPPPQNQTIAFATGGPVSGRAGTTVTNVASGGAGTGAVTYASSDNAVATVNTTSGVATLLLQGTTTITATKSASTGFNSASATYQLTVTAENQTIAFAQAGPVSSRAGTTVTNVASGGAGTGTVTYASSNTAIATVNASGVATLLAPGTTTITATKAGSIGFDSATASYQLIVTVDTQAIAFAQAGPLTGTVGGTITNVASGGAGTGAITYTSSATTVATVNSTSGVATLLAPGTTTITATKAASPGFNSATATYQLNVNPVPQTLAFAQAGPLTGAVGGMLANIASGGAGTGAITYTSSATAVATVNSTSGVATLLAQGTTTITATKAASPGFNSSTASYQLNVNPAQTIAFAQAGPLTGTVGSIVTNVASGGAGTGAITYVSSDTAVATVNSVSGAATLLAPGTTIITATKAVSPGFNSATATYQLNVSPATFVRAWVGEQMSEVFLPATADGKSFARAKVSDCTLVVNDLTNCTNVESSPVNGAAILDNKTTLSTAAYHAIVDGATSGVPIFANVKRFSERILHGAVFFKNRYWVIGGATPTLPGALPTVHVPQSDVWSSSDGKTWKLETANAAFGPRWLHQTLVFNNAIWILGGSTQTNGVGTREVWRSQDGVNWAQVAPAPLLPPITFTGAMAATVFNNAMWIVLNGQTFSSQDGIAWLPRSAPGAIDGSLPREHASFTVYDNKLWYIGGARVFSPTTRFAMNDVWSSSDGSTWTPIAVTTPFAARYQHAAFVLNNRLWIFGGQRFSVQTAGPPPKDAWSTTDGVNWQPEAQGTEIDFSWLMGTVQQADRVTLIGGVLRAYSSQVWQTTNGNTWTELAPFDFAPHMLSRGAVFNGAMWVIGGSRMDGLDTNDIWRSVDGLTWSRVTPTGPIFSPRDSHRVLAFNNRLWVIGGWDFFSTDGGTETFNNEVWSSADGVSWTQHTPSGAIFSPRASHEAVVFNGRMWVIGGSGGSTLYNDVWSSADGVTWVLEQANAAFSPRYAHAVVAFNNALWLFVGATPSGATPSVGTSVGLQDAWRSTDGVTWTQLPTPAFATRMEPAATVFNGRIYLMAGLSDDSYFGGTRFNDVWSTADGMTWQLETAAAAFSGRNGVTLLNHNNELYLMGGFSITRPHDIWRSDDGINWSTAFSHPISAP